MCPQVFPHRLAALLDNEISQRDKVALANHFCSLKMCCLDTFSTRLRKYMEATGFGPDDLAMPQGRLRRVVILASKRKLTNSELECNFARAVSQRLVTRGRAHGLDSMVSKFVLSELQKEHQQARLSHFDFENAHEGPSDKASNYNGFTL